MQRGESLSGFDKVLRAALRSGDTLTANPAEHICRARKILDRGRLSEILYAALELRFAVERMAHIDLIFSEDVSNRVLDEPSPVKKVANLRRMAPESEFPHDVMVLNRTNGEYVKMGEYRPLDKARVTEIQGRLGDLLHPRDDLSLGMPADPWYRETYEFLEASLDYLGAAYKDNTPFFAYEGLDHIRLERQ
jgi:hypothetical protein